MKSAEFRFYPRIQAGAAASWNGPLACEGNREQMVTVALEE
jgi:hypothetical protein